MGKVSEEQAGKFNFIYIDDKLSLKNTPFVEYLEFIYPYGLEIKETTETAIFSYIDCYLCIDNGKIASF